MSLSLSSFAFARYLALNPIWESSYIKLDIRAKIFDHFRKGHQLFLVRCLLVSWDSTYTENSLNHKSYDFPQASPHHSKSPFINNTYDYLIILLEISKKWESGHPCSWSASWRCYLSWQNVYYIMEKVPDGSNGNIWLKIHGTVLFFSV